MPSDENRRKTDAFSSKLIRYGSVAGALIAVMTLVSIVGDSRYNRKDDAMKCEANLRNEISSIKQDNTAISTDLKLLREDTRYIRERLDGMK